MTVVGAMLLAGVPPTGLGLFARNQVPAGGPWRWFAVDERIGGGAIFAAAKSRGPVFLFRGPDAWAGSAWRETLPALVANAIALGADGILPNPERPIDDPAAFGRALADAARRVRVGVVTLPGMGQAPEMVRAAGPAVWWSIELYSQSVSEAEVPRFVSRWRAMVGLRLVPAIAAFRPPRDDDRTLDTPQGYGRYLDSLPLSSGAIAWPVHPIPEHMTAALSRRFGLVSAVASLPIAAATFATSIGGALALLGALALAFVLVSMGAL